MRFLLFPFCVLLLISAAFAQTDRGTITGTIADPTGAMISGATVVAKNSQTGAEHQAASTATGNYTLAQIPNGTYELTVSVSGFKTYVRPGIIVPVAQVVRVDVKLEVGQISEMVTVQADAPLLKTESGELSHNVSTDRIDNLPLITLGGAAGLGNIRNPLQVVTLLPGSAFSNDNTLRVNGMPSSSQAIRIEGQDATNGMFRQLNQVNQAGLDAIQEVSVQTSNFAAEYGQAGGGYFNYTMKSGTNQLHGSVYDYNVNEAYNAGMPFTNDGTGNHIKNRQRRNDYGFTLGGPVFLPKLYDGKEKSFFFFNFEQFRENQRISTGIATMPTDAYKAGDFSAALGPQIKTLAGAPVVDPLGRPVYQNEIYNPNNTSIAPNGAVVRNPFMGCDGQHMNVICNTPGNANYAALDPVASQLQSLLPTPNLPGVFNNYRVPSYENFRHTTITSFKIDHSLSSMIKLSGYFSSTITRSPNANGFTQPWTPATATDTHSYTARFNYDQTVTPTLLFHIGVGYMQTTQPSMPTAADRNSFGFDNSFFADVYPYIGGMMGAGAKGGFSVGFGQLSVYRFVKDEKPTGNASLTWVKGNHTIKAGGEVVFEGLPTSNLTRSNGFYGMSPNETAILQQDGSPWNATTGFTYASFLLGQADSLQVSQATASRLGNHSMGLFVQDTWKVTPRLTLDYGLRWDYATLLREQYGRMQNADFSKPNPLTGNLPGMMIYEATCNCDFNKNYPYSFGPRLGVAYQITSKTVFRAGAGIMYGTSPNSAMLSLSVPDFNTYAAQGFGNPAVVLKNGNPDPNLVWPDFSNHYPAETMPGVRPPATPFISISDNTGRLPRIFQWSIGLQREIARNLVVEASYVGNRGAWWSAPLLSTQNYNALTPEGLLAERLYGDTTGLDLHNDAQRALLTLPISNPAVLAKFPQLADPNSVYPGFPASQPLKQALRPHPQWNGIPPFLGPPMGDTWYDSLQAKLTKRFSHGLDLQTAFTWQKELTLGANSDTTYVTPAPTVINDVFNRDSNKQLSALSRPFMLVVSFNYLTPKIGAENSTMRVLSLIARDWSFGGVLRYQSGQLIRTPASNNQLLTQLARDATQNPAMYGGGQTLMNRVSGVNPLAVDPNCHCFDPTTTLVLNPAAWSDPGPGNFGTAAPYYNDVRWQRQPSESLSLGRNFPIREGKATFSVRIEFQNVFNRLFLANPIPVSAGGFGASMVGINTTAPVTHNAAGQLTGGYGYVNTVNGGAATPRSGQIVARLTF